MACLFYSTPTICHSFYKRPRDLVFELSIVVAVFAPLGNIWQYLETFLIAMTVGQVLLACSKQRPRMLLNILHCMQETALCGASRVLVVKSQTLRVPVLLAIQ